MGSFSDSSANLFSLILVSEKAGSERGHCSQPPPLQLLQVVSQIAG
jgi:hypothetical protein